MSYKVNDLAIVPEPTHIKCPLCKGGITLYPFIAGRDRILVSPDGQSRSVEILTGHYCPTLRGNPLTLCDELVL